MSFGKAFYGQHHAQACQYKADRILLLSHAELVQLIGWLFLVCPVAALQVYEDGALGWCLSLKVPAIPQIRNRIHFWLQTLSVPAVFHFGS